MNLDKKYIIRIVFISVLLGLGYNLLSGKLPWFREELSVEVAEEISTETNEVELQGIRTIQAKLLFDEGIPFIDARDHWDFNEGHIQGAVNIPEYKFEPDEPKLKQFDKNKPMVVYCSGNDCDVSIKLGKKMAELGFTNLYIYLGGWKEWEEAGLPIEKNEENN